MVLVPHQGPDGDAMGSVLALFLFFRNKGLRSAVVVPNEYPSFLNWLPGNERVVNYSLQREEAEAILLEADLIFHVDHNDVQRTGPMRKVLEKCSALRGLIDHQIGRAHV